MCVKQGYSEKIYPVKKIVPILCELILSYDKLGEDIVWFNIPFATLVMWIFYSIEKVGEISENPFEGNPNDTPITALSRTIEIDLREMLDETDIPEPLTPNQKILM